MNTQDIKQTIASRTGISNLSFNFARQFDERVLEPTEQNAVCRDPKTNAEFTASYDPAKPDVKFHVRAPWVSHWDNDKRVRVVMHENVAEIIRTNRAIDTLAVKFVAEPAKGDRLAYTRATIITPQNIELAF